MTKTLPLLLAATAAVLGGWLGGCFGGVSTQAAQLQAGAPTLLQDSDEDFLPDVVEWAVMSNAANPDTDGDGCPDFVEVVQRGSPRVAGVARPLDHEMRCVVTAPSANQPGSLTWLHLLFRFVGSPSLMSSFQCWVNLPSMPGVRIPLDMLAFSTIEYAQRQTMTEGLWVRISVPLVSEQILRQLLPCSIQAEATIGGRTINTMATLFDMQGVVSTLVPFADGRMAVQSIGQLSGPTSSGSNKVCLLALQQMGSSPGGNVFQVIEAHCDDCNDLECSPGCPASLGWIFTIPGGLESITGG